ncbi:hypothetical protein [Saccharomonospora iraqiensis]|uniref:hypothetical protein n=1 Tax=Saccharomonospora iraqiensis TaxID=52698 RepID=UPI00047E7B1D|nr:hypothetical protein [Saccharomonospora iraqiensis]
MRESKTGRAGTRRSGTRRRVLGGTMAAMLAFAATTVATLPAAADEGDGGPAASDLAGNWAPFDRCPVDDPAMLDADGDELAALCLASSSESGTMTIGEKTVPTAGTDLQFGLLGDGVDYTTVSPGGTGIEADPVKVPGGLLNLMCPSDIPVLTTLCERAAGSSLNTVTATVEPAGDPSDFNLNAGLSTGQPIVTLPIKIKLDNPLLGGNCYIGSNEEPILLEPANAEQPMLNLVRYAPDGTTDPTGVMSNIALSGADQVDDSFAVPGADGCGLFGALDWAVDSQLGLPSPEGANSLVLHSADTTTGGFYTPANFTPNQGEQLADHWHAAHTD